MNRCASLLFSLFALSCASPLPTVRTPQPATASNCLLRQGTRCAAERLSPGSTFAIDISDLVRHLAPLPKDERADQLTDWTVYGTLAQANLPAELLRGVTYDKNPFRLRATEDVASRDYGSGRHVLLADQSVWVST